MTRDAWNRFEALLATGNAGQYTGGVRIEHQVQAQRHGSVTSNAR